MGSRGGMNSNLYEYINDNFPDSKADLYSVFIEQCKSLGVNNGFFSMITQQGWMFLTSFAKMRSILLQQDDIVNLLHLGPRAFDEINGEVVQSVSFIIRKTNIHDYRATYCRLLDGMSEKEKETMFLNGVNRFFLAKSNFLSLEENPIAYWLSNNMFCAFRNKTLGLYAKPRQGMATSDNNKFLRLWPEVNWNKVFLSAKNEDEAIQSNAKWFPYNKGGGFRKWFGNNEYLINWGNSGQEVKALAVSLYKSVTRTIKNIQFYFQEGVTWSTLSSGIFNARYCSEGFLFDTKGSTCFFDDKTQIPYITAFLNSIVANELLKVLAPTLDYNAGSIAKLPVIIQTDNRYEIGNLFSECLNTSKSDWDSFETSWDFQTHPLIKFRMAGAYAWGNAKPSSRISSAFKAWELLAEGQFEKLKANEEELNRIFIDIYGLQDELTPEVADKDVTVRKADLGREIRSFISYAVGSMFGRYSLDTPGLAYAGGDWDSGKYHSYIPEDDNILPITDADYFEDDIVMRFVDFVKVVYGEDTLAENLEFIARALYPNGNGTAREMIRRYFQSDFFKDHCKIYQKRPIYWLFDSGKQNGFKSLIYLHRYDKYTVARVRTEYLHPLQRKYEAEIQRMDKLADLPETSARDKAEFRKQSEKIEKQIAECRAYDQIISHIAAQTIELDLDDGVKVNYEKFQGVEVPRDDGKGTVKMDLLGNI